MLFDFVYHSPSKKGSVNSKKFKDYGIITPQYYSKVINKIKNGLKLVKNKNYFFLKNDKITQNHISIFNEAIKNRKDFFCFKPNSIGHLDSIYNRIRNSFAHGNFYKQAGFYIAWNEDAENLKALFVLSIDTLKYLTKVYKEPF